jgi:serine/threonine-protein kinase
VATDGDVLDGRYRLDQLVASGGMGDVWRATDTVLGRAVAVKLLHADRAADTGFQARFRHEARSMAALHHPNVADVYDFGETEDGSGYIVMAFVDGQPLSERIATAGRLDVATTMAVVAQAARGLHAAHRAGIVHRDVKPANLVVRPDGTVVLVDFGVARSPSSTVLTGVHEVVGTASYLAPEQVTKAPTGPATDIYALGAVAYQCLAGHPPFLGDNPVTVAMHHLHDDPPPLPADVTPAARDLVSRAMAKDPADRFPSAAAMAEAADAATGRSADRAGLTAVLPLPIGNGVARPRRTAAALWAAVLLALTGLVVVLALAGSRVGRSDPGTPPAPGASQQLGSAGAGPSGRDVRSGSPGRPSSSASVAGSPGRSTSAGTAPTPPPPTAGAPSQTGNVEPSGTGGGQPAATSPAPGSR